MRTAQFQTVEGEDLVLESVRANGRVVGRMLDMHLEQRFRNPEPTNVEVVYTFPLPWRAVLLGLEVELNGETLTAMVKAKSAARAEYEEALSEGNTGILLTVNRDRSYTLELGNLMASETCVIRLHYAQVLQPEQGSLRLTLPTTLAPRYGSPTQDGGYEPHAVPDISTTAEYPFDIHLTIQGELVFAQIGSPTHKVALRNIPAVGMKESHVMDIRLASRAWLDRDFVLIFSELPHASIGLSSWDRLDAGLGVVMASFTPKLPMLERKPVTMKVLVDCSGSMNGDSIHAARSALQGILAGLQETDRFSLSRFGTSVEHRGKALWKGANAAMAAARRWVEKLEADMGGTEMNHAILSTLALPGAKQCDLLLITDGSIYSIDEVIETARQSGHRFFVIGIGSSVSEGLLRRLAEETHGSCEFVAPGEQVEPSILRLFNRMRSPVVTQARVEWPPACEVHAASDLPKNIFSGDDVTVTARVKTQQVASLMQPVRLYGCVDGTEDFGKGEMLLAELTPAFIADEENTLARLAASQRYWQLRKGAEDVPAVLTKQLPALAEKYQLVTDDTSLILVKKKAEGEQAQDMPELKQVKGMLAAGWGGQGSVTASRVRFYQSEPKMRFGIGHSAHEVQLSVTNERVRQIESKAVRKLKSPNRSEKLRAFINELDGAPTLSNLERLPPAPKAPDKTPEFWNDGSAYSQDTATWPLYEGLTPAGFVEWLRLNPDLYPGRYMDLANMGVPRVVLEWLELVIGQGMPEGAVVTIFAELMAGHDFTFLQSVAQALGQLKGPSQESMDGLKQKISTSLEGVTSFTWPACIVDFAEISNEEMVGKNDGSTAVTK